MIVGDLRNDIQNSKALHPVLHEAIEVLRTTDFSQMESGTYELKGKMMFMILQEYETLSGSDVLFEKHAAHIDVQYMISGTEQIGWASYAAGMVPDEDKLAERDIAFFRQVSPSAAVPMEEGRYVILFPNDLHQPCVRIAQESPVPVRKAVIKIHIDLLKS